jgi:hypothetical protein
MTLASVKRTERTIYAIDNFVWRRRVTREALRAQGGDRRRVPP